MKNLYYSSIIFLFTIISFGQTGVNTVLPLHPFHVDPKKDTNSVTLTQTTDDFVITSDGKVGIGTIAPQAKLEINGKLKLVDGTQADNRIIMGDALGVARWETLPSITPTIQGYFESAAVKSDASSPTYLDSKAYIELPKGKWIVNLGLTIDNQNDYAMWLHAYLSSSNTTKEQVGFVLLGRAGNNTAFASGINGKLAYNSSVTKLSAFGLLNGSVIVNVTADKVKLYVLIEKFGNWSFAGSSWENYLYAIPII